MKSFTEAINEGKVTIDGMNFVISTVYQNGKFGVQFIPDGRTLDAYSKNEQVEAITSKITKKVPVFKDILVYDMDNMAAGLVFVIDKYELASMLEKNLK